MLLFKGNVLSEQLIGYERAARNMTKCKRSQVLMQIRWNQ